MRAVLFLALTLPLFGQIYTIQLMSFTKKSSLTPYFMKLVKRSSYPHKIVREEGVGKILIGEFTTKKAAQEALKKLRCLPKDAFVRPLRETPKRSLETTKSVTKKASKKRVVAVRKVPCDTPKSCGKYKNKKERRLCEIHEAVTFYKNSRYYAYMSRHSR